jgi:hypothetical protein
VDEADRPRWWTAEPGRGSRARGQHGEEVEPRQGERPQGKGACGPQQPRRRASDARRQAVLDLAAAGGGAIRGIDEKLSVNQATGTASLTVPVKMTVPGASLFLIDTGHSIHTSARFSWLTRSSTFSAHGTRPPGVNQRRRTWRISCRSYWRSSRAMNARASQLPSTPRTVALTSAPQTDRHRKE